jgi:hypothetical protein
MLVLEKLRATVDEYHVEMMSKIFGTGTTTKTSISRNSLPYGWYILVVVVVLVLEV